MEQLKSSEAEVADMQQKHSHLRKHLKTIETELNHYKSLSQTFESHE